MCRLSGKRVGGEFISLVGKEYIRGDTVCTACFRKGIQIICGELFDTVTNILDEGSGIEFAVRMYINWIGLYQHSQHSKCPGIITSVVDGSKNCLILSCELGKKDSKSCCEN